MKLLQPVLYLAIYLLVTCPVFVWAGVESQQRLVPSVLCSYFNYLDHALLHGRIISIDPYPLLSASVTVDYLHALLHDRLITIDHYLLSSVSVNYSQLLSPIQGLFSLPFLCAWDKPYANTIHRSAAIWSC
jgi:hypothetical protein